MPPKPKPAASKKTDQKKKEKVIEDKTFGLKNKKGAKQQKFINQVEKQVKSGGVPARKVDDPKKSKDAKAQEQKEMALLFRPVQKVEKGADPKSVVCAFFKQGQCTKGNKCKFSHDLTIERKAEKRSIYVDMRDDEDGNPIENGGREFIEKFECDKNKPSTDIVCKFFLDAVENNKYGWFWNCPNGEHCKYRHALPKGYVLKKDRKKDKKEEISLEDLIEKERAALASIKFTKITLESFLAWKKRKLREKIETAKKDEEKKRQDYKAGRAAGISGREMFSFNPELATGDNMEDGDEALNSYQMNDEEEAVNLQYREIQLDRLGFEATEVEEGTITEAPVDRLAHHVENLIHGAQDDDDEGAGVVFNENLFVEDDLDEIEQELDELDLEEGS